jgi:hypothetical protein
MIGFQFSFSFRDGTRSSVPDKIKVSEFSSSLYHGNIFSVFLEIEGTEISQPRPNTPFPFPES